jgi:4-hydroxy-tetrahydrodipicolinate reductase
VSGETRPHWHEVPQAGETGRGGAGTKPTRNATTRRSHKMQSIVAGDGAMGRAVAVALAGRGTPPLAILGMPATPAGHDPADFRGADVLFDFSVGEAVLPNVRSALDGGVRNFVIGTTNWASDRAALGDMLANHQAPAVASPSFSLGVMLFARLVEAAARLFGPFAEYDPYIVEWHRRTKEDRPSGTALELSRRLIAAHPRKERVARGMAYGAPAPEELDVAVIRAGSSPGMHLVGFDAPGESMEMRLTARDRSAYAAGALTAADWLLAEPRSPGFHTFDYVLDSILAAQGGAPQTETTHA